MTEGVPAARARLVLVTVLLGTFTVSLNNTSLNPAIPLFMAEFGIGAATASWIVTGFMLAMGLTMPVTGFLSQRLGSRRLYLFGLSLFIGGSILGAWASSIEWLLAARALQGLASGLMIPLSLSLIFAVYPQDQRGRVTSLWGSLVMLAPAIGPVVGGGVVEFAPWLWLFVMNIPVGLAGLAVGFFALPEAERRSPTTFDWQGFLLVSVGIGLLLICASRLTDPAALANGWNLAGLVIALAALAGFVRVELSKADPLLNLRLFAIAPYRISVVIVVVHAIGMFGCLFLIPLYMQLAGYGPGLTGLALLVAAVCSSLFVSLGGRVLDKRGPRWLVASGLLVTAIANIGFGIVASSVLLVVFGFMAVRGMGVGLSYMPATTAGLNAIPEHWVTQGSAMNNILRRISAALALVLVSVFYEWRSADLLNTTGNAQAAGLAAIHELFIALGLSLALTLPMSLRLHSGTPRDEAKVAPQFS